MEDFKYTFNEDEWTIYLIEDHDTIIEDEDTIGLTRFEEKELYFRRGELSKDVIRHELWHVYFSYCFLGDTNDITVADFEEIAAGLFSHKCERMMAVTDDLYKKLIELRDK